MNRQQLQLQGRGNAMNVDKMLSWNNFAELTFIMGLLYQHIQELDEYFINVDLNNAISVFCAVRVEDLEL